MAQIVGFNLKKIKAEKEATEIKREVDIKSNFSIIDIKKEEIPLGKEKEVLSFDFKFDVVYEPKIAVISFEGFVLLMADEKEAKEILKEWKKKNVKEELRLLIYNQILIKCSIKALQYEEEFNLPFHLPMPRFTQQPPIKQAKENKEKGKTTQDYTG